MSDDNKSHQPRAMKSYWSAYRPPPPTLYAYMSVRKQAHAEAALHR